MEKNMKKNIYDVSIYVFSNYVYIQLLYKYIYIQLLYVYLVTYTYM